MVPLKNVRGILEAFKLLIKQKSNVQLVMVGDREQAIMELAVNELQIPASFLKVLGEIPYKQVASEMQKSQCLILFSNIENSPCVIIEALSCGLPVIATTVGGIPELVDTSNGLLVAPRNNNELLTAMVRMLNNYSGYDQQKIAEHAASKFSYPVIGKKLDEVYTSIVSDKA